jgi:hypothetical protein
MDIRTETIALDEDTLESKNYIKFTDKFDTLTEIFETYIKRRKIFCTIEHQDSNAAKQVPFLYFVST